MEEEILAKGIEISNWESNDKIERLIKYNNNYYTLATDWERTKIYPNTLQRVRFIEENSVTEMVRQYERSRNELSKHQSKNDS